MGLIGRRDRVLILGLTVGLSVVFARPISHLLDVARQNEESYGLALIPGLIILTVVFLLHQQNKRQEIKAEAVASASWPPSRRSCCRATAVRSATASSWMDRSCFR